ncbi:hypothetical protein HUJ04_011236 [Dendroctonus ponderosae]|nr:hypothetical protein HUJ04_011236 [Dendroctonus ponderosae]
MIDSPQVTSTSDRGRSKMPRTFSRKTHRGSWTSETLQAALTVIESGRAIQEVLLFLEILFNIDVEGAEYLSLNWDDVQRNPQIRLRKPESTSINCVTAFNKREIGIFFANLNAVMDKYKFSPPRIFNCYGTGITTVQHPSKIDAE